MANNGIEAWSRTPKHILRYHCLLDVLKINVNGRDFLEVGAGSGDFTRMFLAKGFRGCCYDLGEKNRKILRRNLRSYESAVTVIDSLDEIAGKKFDLLLAFEVLEHIQNDAEALKVWSKYLADGGWLLVSVPAHMSKYSKEDKRVGHFRRYEKKTLCEMLENACFENIEIFNYGFPLGNLTRFMSLLFVTKDYEKDRQLSMEERSIKSGVVRVDMLNRLSFLFNEFTMLPFVMIQKIFYQCDLGDGYVIRARKRNCTN